MDPEAVEESRKKLEAFVVNNDDLEHLEALLSQFNIFEALGAVRHELRHSDFLAFLLNPAETHSLGDYFLRRFLQRALIDADASQARVSSVELDVLDLEGADVRREWSSIDIRVVDDRSKLAVIIENKIDSSEHSDQLARYMRLVEKEFVGYRVVGIYLTPEGEAPSDQRYVALDYDVIAELIERMLKARTSRLGPDVRTLLDHYAQMIRRHIVNESEIAELCRRIYRTHKDALDLIFEHRPDRQATLRDALEKLVGERDDLILDECSKVAVRFAPKAWETPTLREGQRWTKTGRILLFEFANGTESLILKLLIGPGPAQTREGLFKMAMSEPTLFRGATNVVGKFHCQVFRRAFLESKAYDGDDESLLRTVREQWAGFLANDLPTLVGRVTEQKWLFG